MLVLMIWVPLMVVMVEVVGVRLLPLAMRREAVLMHGHLEALHVAVTPHVHALHVCVWEGRRGHVLVLVHLVGPLPSHWPHLLRHATPPSGATLLHGVLRQMPVWRLAWERGPCPLSLGRVCCPRRLGLGAMGVPLGCVVRVVGHGGSPCRVGAAGGGVTHAHAVGALHVHRVHGLGCHALLLLISLVWPRLVLVLGLGRLPVARRRFSRSSSSVGRWLPALGARGLGRGLLKSGRRASGYGGARGCLCAVLPVSLGGRAGRVLHGVSRCGNGPCLADCNGRCIGRCRLLGPAVPRACLQHGEKSRSWLHLPLRGLDCC